MQSAAPADAERGSIRLLARHRGTDQLIIIKKERTINVNTIVVGASAGGVEALQMLVAGLPATFPSSVLVVLHIPAHTPSHLHTILARAGPLPVTPAVDGEALRPGHIYVAPTDRHLLVEGSRLRVTRGPKENRMRPSVDVLFRSAAYSLRERVIGIILSGLLDDGTAGLWAIKDQGGLAVVQSPEDALHPSMPISALQHVKVDYTLPVADMSALLSKIVYDVPSRIPRDPSREIMRVESHIALECDALEEGVMELGPFP